MATDPRITRINEISALARTAWFTLLAYLVFVGITLLGVEDADFFVPSRQTQLPLVGVEIPTAAFFWTAPVLGAALYTYLHLFLIKLWEAHAEAEPTAADPIHNWLVNDFALIQRGDPTAHARPLAWLTDWITWALVWAAGPFVLAYFWLRSLPAHSEFMSLVSAACLLLALHVGFRSWQSADKAFGIVPRHRNGRPLRHHLGKLWKRRDPLYLGVFLLCVTLLTTEFPLQIGYFSTLPRAYLSGEQLVPLPEDWRTPEAARKAFRMKWCAQEALPPTACDHLPEADRPTPPHVALARARWCKKEIAGEGVSCANLFASYDARFAEDWKVERKSALENLPDLNLATSDLRQVNAVGASLNGADLWNAQIGGAILWYARLEGAILRKARMQKADLRGARLENADLRQTQMEGVDLREARMEGAFLDEARMEGADLRAADLRSVSWTGAHVTSPAQDVDFRGAKNLSQEQLDTMIGNAETLLPDGLAPDTNRPYSIPSCWQEPPAVIVKQWGPFLAYDWDEDDDGLLCPAGQAPRQTGTPCALDLTREACRDPARNPHHPETVGPFLPGTGRFRACPRNTRAQPLS